MTTTVRPAGPRYTPTVSPPARYPQLDGLRAVAVLLVLWSHAGPRWFAGLGEWGFGGLHGVWLFYVLSGFLITGILLRLREAPRWKALQAFYLRRALRIVPPFYALLGLFVLFRFPVAHLWLHAAYLTNWLQLAGGVPPSIGHFWTLAVEEQFYLVWPWLVLTLDRRHLPALFVGAIVVALAVRVAAPFGAFASLQPTPANFDSFGLGALLAWHRAAQAPALTRLRWLERGCHFAVGLLVVTVALSLTHRLPRVFVVIEPLAASLLAVWWIDRAVDARGGSVLSLRPIRAIGRVSYTVYLIQSPIVALLPLPRDERGVPIGSVAAFVGVTALSLAYAAFSWRYLEGPISRRKHLVRYPL